MSQCVVCAAEIRDDARFCPACGAEQPKQATASDDQDPFIGQVVAKNFRIESLLGVGGMGKVYKARQLSLDKDVVIKILHDHFRDDPQLVQRFQREARAASRLNHPNSIQVIDFGQDDNGVLFMAIEFLNGRDLFAILKDDGPLPTERLSKIMIQVCSALAEAHAQNVIHRDLKPENIMIVDHRGTEHVKVLDFGIAKIQDPDETPGQALTQAGMVCGTPEYMSPEQARGLKLDHRSDLYALGVVCYQLATGELPFTADTPIGIVTKHILEEPDPPRAKYPNLDVAVGIEELILKSMAKDADARFATASEMGTAFEELLRIETSQSQPLAAAPAPAPAPPVGGTMVGISAAPPSGAPAPAPAHPTSGGAQAPPPVVVRTISADGQVVTGPTATNPTPTQGLDAFNDNVPMAPGGGGGAAKWVAVIALFLILGAAGGVFAFKDVLFPTDPIIAGGPGTASPEAKDPEPKTAEPPSPESSPEAAIKKDPIKKDPIKKDPIKKDPIKKDPIKKDPIKKVVVSASNRAAAKELIRDATKAFNKGNLDEVHALSKKALKLDPSNPDPLRQIAFVNMTRGQSVRACLAIKDFVKRKKGLSRAKARGAIRQYCKKK